MAQSLRRLAYLACNVLQGQFILNLALLVKNQIVISQGVILVEKENTVGLKLMQLLSLVIKDNAHLAISVTQGHLHLNHSLIPMELQRLQRNS